eukprot:5288212-Prymnesium_polylepis.1
MDEGGSAGSGFCRASAHHGQCLANGRLANDCFCAACTPVSTSHLAQCMPCLFGGGWSRMDRVSVCVRDGVGDGKSFTVRENYTRYNDERGRGSWHGPTTRGPAPTWLRSQERTLRSEVLSQFFSDPKSVGAAAPSDEPSVRIGLH